ncbi:hypothetical protein D3C78_17560 [compost metagenome]
MLSLSKLIRFIFFGVLIFGTLFFFVLPNVFPWFSVSKFVNSPKWEAAIQPWKEAANKDKPTDTKETANKNEQELVRTDRIWFIPAILVGLAIFSYGGYYLFIRSRNKMVANTLIYYKVIPFGTFDQSEVNIQKGFLISLAQNMKNPWDAAIMGQPWFRYIIKRSAGDGGIEVIFGIPEDRAEPFLNSFSGYYDKIQLKALNEAEQAAIVPEKKQYKVSTFSLLSKDPLPVKMFTGGSGEPDPLAIIMAGIGAGKPSDIDIIVDTLIRPVSESKKLYKVGAQYIYNLKENRSDESDIPSILAGNDKTKKSAPKISEFEKDYAKVVKERSTAPEKAFNTSVRIYATGNGEDDLLMALKSASDGFVSLSAFNSFVSEPVLDPWRMKKKVMEGRFGVHEGFIMSTAELVSWIRVPHNGLSCFQHMQTIDAQVVRAPQSIGSHSVTAKEMFLIDMDNPNSVFDEENFVKEEEEITSPSPEEVSPSLQKPTGVVIPPPTDLDWEDTTPDEEEINAAMAEFEKKLQSMSASSEPENEEVIMENDDDEDQGFDF